MREAKKIISLSELYHENSKEFPHLIKIGPILEKELVQFMVESKKEYSGCRKVKLKQNGKLRLSLEKALKRRCSIREFSRDEISFAQLSKILALSYGPRVETLLSKFNEQSYPYYLRTAPSAGALYSCEIYIITQRVKGLKRGIYYFNADRLQLELLKRTDCWDNFLSSLPDQSSAKDASCAILISGRLSKIKFKYGERGYRYLFLDAGHIGENIYLVATALNLGIVGIGGFYDDELNKLLSLDGYEESVIYILLIGIKRKVREKELKK